MLYLIRRSFRIRGLLIDIIIFVKNLNNALKHKNLRTPQIYTRIANLDIAKLNHPLMVCDGLLKIM